MQKDGIAVRWEKTPLGKRKEMLEVLNRDMVKLDQLTSELKMAVAKSNTDTLSLDVLHKSEQLEKLAKRIRHDYKDAF